MTQVKTTVVFNSAQIELLSSGLLLITNNFHINSFISWTQRYKCHINDVHFYWSEDIIKCTDIKWTHKWVLTIILINKGAWKAILHGVAKSQTRLSEVDCNYHSNWDGVLSYSSNVPSCFLYICFNLSHINSSHHAVCVLLWWVSFVQPEVCFLWFIRVSADIGNCTFYCCTVPYCMNMWVYHSLTCGCLECLATINKAVRNFLVQDFGGCIF